MPRGPCPAGHRHAGLSRRDRPQPDPALHVQGTETDLGAESETVVAMVPEPETLLLLALGLIPLAFRRRESRRQACRARLSPDAHRRGER